METLHEMIPIIGAALGVLITWAIMALARKYKLKLDQEQVKKYVDYVVKFVEEWAKKKVKAGEEKPTAEDKHKTAVAAIKNEFPTLAADKIEVLLGASLAETDGAGATGGAVRSAND